MNRVALVLGVLVLGVLVVPNNPIVGEAGAENPSNANVYAGDAHRGATVGTGTRHHAFRIVSDSNAASHRSGWEVAPGAGKTVYYEEWVSGTGAPLGPNGDVGADSCRLEVYQDNGATLQRNYFDDDECPAGHTAFTVYCTTDGTSTGTPMAGTLRLRVIAVSKTAGLTVYTADSDAEDKGAIRCGLDADAITMNAYPAGSPATFAFTIAGESMTPTVAHTQAPTQQVRTAQISTLDAAGAVIQTNSVTLTAGATSTASTFTLTDAYPAAATSAGARLTLTGNSVLTGVKWAHIGAATAPVAEPTDATAQRSNFYNADPRVTVTHLLQVNSGSFSSPPMGGDIGDTRTLPDIGYIATRFTNARGEGLSGSTLAYTRTLQDSGAVLAVDTTTCSSSCIGTQGGEAGWSPLFLWNAGGPLGQWNKAVDVTGPSAIDSNSHLLTSTQTLFLELPEGGGTIYVNSTSVADPLTVNAAYGDGTLMLAIQSMLLDARALEGVAELIDIDIWDLAGDLVVDSANPVEVGLGSYRYENATFPDGIYFIRTTTPHPDNGTVGADNVVVVDNNLADHRDNSLELTMNNDFAGFGFDGFAFALFWLVGLVYFLRQAKSFCAAACTAGIFVSIFLGGFGGWTQAGALLILAFMVWLEAVSRDKLYQRILGQKGQGDKQT
ncbi:MAG: hypothetical protein ACYC2H_06475 [Thermoplasmatota archaeon]